MRRLWLFALVLTTLLPFARSSHGQTCNPGPLEVYPPATQHLHCPTTIWADSVPLTLRSNRTITIDAPAQVTGGLSVEGPLSVGGDAIMWRDVVAHGAVAVEGNLAVGGEAIMYTHLQVNGPSDFHGASDFYGSVYVGHDVDVGGMTSTGVLTITGGSDVAEAFPVGNVAAIDPGTVMVIDGEHPGLLKMSDTPYDRKVAGIVSGAGGIKAGVTLGDSAHATGIGVLAMAGRVYCKADALKGPIAPGDLLTTSTVPGYAMRAENVARAQGAIIGKAMTPLRGGRGLVLVLVSLQ